MTTPPLSLRNPTDSTHDYTTSPDLYLFTSLTAGSSHIITATSRLETILKANRVPFRAVDIATDEAARRIWTRRAGKRKLPGLVKEAMIVADLEQVEEWNEFGEIKQELGGEGRVMGGVFGKAAAGSSASGGLGAAAKNASKSDAEAPKPLSTKEEEIPKPQAQQASLAAEAAAAARSKLKPTFAPAPTKASKAEGESKDANASDAEAKAAKPVPVPTSSGNAPAQSTTEIEIPAAAETEAEVKSEEPKPTITSETDTETPSRALSPRSPPTLLEQEAADEFLDASSPPKHNTSATAGLPPLSLRTKAASPPLNGAGNGVRGRPRDESVSSISYPDPPPPTAVDTVPPVLDLSKGVREGLRLKGVPEEGGRDEDGDEDDENNEDKDDKDEDADKTKKQEEEKEGRNDTGHVRIRGEETAKEGEDGEGYEDTAQKVKFAGDQEKGDPKDETKVGDSVLD